MPEENDIIWTEIPTGCYLLYHNETENAGEENETTYAVIEKVKNADGSEINAFLMFIESDDAFAAATALSMPERTVEVYRVKQPEQYRTD